MNNIRTLEEFKTKYFGEPSTKKVMSSKKVMKISKLELYCTRQDLKKGR